MQQEKKPHRRWIQAIWIINLICLAFFALLWLSLQLTGVGEQTYANSKDPQATKILFIGNSFTFVNSTPRIFSWLLRTQRPHENFLVQSFTWPGSTLKEHSQREEVKNLLSKHAWDIVVLQDQSKIPLSGPASLKSSFSTILPLANRSGTKKIAIMTWANRGYFSDANIISQCYKRVGRELNLPVVPVGDLFFYIQERYPEIQLYQNDDWHPGLAGSYLYALALYEQLFGQLPSIANSDTTGDAPQIKAPVNQKILDCLREWPSLSKARPEFAEESPQADMDIAKYWAINARTQEAEELCRKRLDMVGKMFPANTDQRAEALRELALVESMQKTPEKIAQAKKDYVLAQKIFQKTDPKSAAEVTHELQELGSNEDAASNKTPASH